MTHFKYSNPSFTVVSFFPLCILTHLRKNKFQGEQMTIGVFFITFQSGTILTYIVCIG